ncbi:transcriptional activator NhaR [Thauera mechernichensis]|uniref:Transcriptional activator NhaR n=1 Tax=Thauera mechernichensis TaxID=82788 RepID=A0ABW3WGJ9_9RHOO|nr:MULTISPECIES: transcriptional activator NhaR [Thauera]ENO75994.1 LysR family transcriptional regulator [Thauera sp. 27]ENO94475.1 LysR family transcriptional regulator [Thauera sp. 28]MDG3063361.1 transcriptional activator NhaR [Thauera mechernichensis]WBL63349.1 transcriptional activator NhaR [Thauera sp. WB-2]HAG74092.1 transcriptional activator NhaR [Thauera sp.]
MLNYKQLHHFWTAARAGGIVRGAERSGLAPQTVSGQIAALETELGVNLFKRQGRKLALTETGRMVLDYAEEIFRLGSELEEALRSRSAGRAMPFRVGVADVVPKAIAWLLLAPSMDLAEPMRIVCREGKFDALLGELAIHKLDVVLADSPLPPSMDVRGYSHALGTSTIGLYATPTLADALQGSFPACLDGAPLLLPGAEASVRTPLLRWLETERLRPRIVGEFDDSALMRAFAEAGAGLFPSASLVGEQLCRQAGMVHLGDARGVTETYYAISVERRLTHPAVRAISEGAARHQLGGSTAD